VQGKIDEEISKNVREMEDEITQQIQGKKYHRNLPPSGWSKEQVLAEIDDMMALGQSLLSARVM